MLRSVLDKERVLLLDCDTKKEALQVLVDCLATTSEIGDQDELASAIFHREVLMSTGIGLGIGIPHVRLVSVKNIVMAVGISHKPIMDYESIDGKPVHLIFMIAAGEKQHREHIKLLASISSLLKDENLRAKLTGADTVDEFCSIILSEKK